MKFDEWLIEYRKDKKKNQQDWYPNQVDIYKAGQQSKQSEISQLKQQIYELEALLYGEEK